MKLLSSMLRRSRSQQSDWQVPHLRPSCDRRGRWSLSAPWPQCMAFPGQHSGSDVYIKNCDMSGRAATPASAHIALVTARPLPGRPCRRHPDPNLKARHHQVINKAQDTETARQGATNLFHRMDRAAAFKLLTAFAGLDLLPLTSQTRCSQSQQPSPVPYCYTHRKWETSAPPGGSHQRSHRGASTHR